MFDLEAWVRRLAFVKERGWVAVLVFGVCVGAAGTAAVQRAFITDWLWNRVHNAEDALARERAHSKALVEPSVVAAKDAEMQRLRDELEKERVARRAAERRSSPRPGGAPPPRVGPAEATAPIATESANPLAPLRGRPVQTVVKGFKLLTGKAWLAPVGRVAIGLVGWCADRSPSVSWSGGTARCAPVGSRDVAWWDGWLYWLTISEVDANMGFVLIDVERQALSEDEWKVLK
jgi:hypothetical protein